MELWVAIVSGIFGGGAMGFIEFLIRRRDARMDKSNEKNKEVLEAISRLDDKISALEQKVDAVDSKGEMRDVTNTRARILRFDDELREKRLHSLEHFQEILRDCDYYDTYCREHTNYENSYAVDAIDNIKKVFRQCKDENNFI